MDRSEAQGGQRPRSTRRAWWVIAAIVALVVVVLAGTAICGLAWPALRPAPADAELEALGALVEELDDAAQRANLEVERLRLREEVERQVSDQCIRLLIGLAPLIAAAVAAIIAWKTSARERALNRSAQLAERFTRAIDQLGDKQLDVRLGGIYALEQIAKDDLAEGELAYRGVIAEVLAAFVRGHAQRAPPDDRDDSDERDYDYGAHKALAELQVRAADVQAAMTVLGRPPDSYQPHKLDLRHVDLRKAYLAGAKLRDAILSGAQLQGANLSDAKLQKATLIDAQLQDANLSEAQLQGANLSDAKLRDAILSGAQLQGANLCEAWMWDAQLGGAQLQKANLSEAYMWGTDLRGADLSEADLQHANLSGSHLSDATTLSGATANRATKWPTGWDRSRLESAGVRFEDNDS